MTKFYGVGEVIEGFGTVVAMTMTAYEVEGGAFVPFTKVHPMPAAVPLVVFA